MNKCRRHHRLRGQKEWNRQRTQQLALAWHRAIIGQLARSLVHVLGAGLEKMTTVLVKTCEFMWMMQICPTYNKTKIHQT